MNLIGGFWAYKMNKNLRSLIISALNSGHSAINIYSDIAHYLYQKRVYNSLEFGRLNPSDFQTSQYKEILADVERIINVLKWDKKAILNNFQMWAGVN